MLCNPQPIYKTQRNCNVIQDRVFAKTRTGERECQYIRFRSFPSYQSPRHSSPLKWKFNCHLVLVHSTEVSRSNISDLDGCYRLVPVQGCWQCSARYKFGGETVTLIFLISLNNYNCSILFSWVGEVELAVFRVWGWCDQDSPPSAPGQTNPPHTACSVSVWLRESEVVREISPLKYFPREHFINWY